MRSLMILGVLSLALAACGGDDGGVEDDTPNPGVPDSLPPVTTAPATPETSATAAPTTQPDTPMGRAVAAAVRDLADRIGVTSDEVDVVLAEAVTWRDGSLGCPQPGMAYTQALVAGRRIVLDVAGSTFVYHAADDGDPFLCEDPQPPFEGEGGGGDT